jgi:acid phosphatase
MPYSGETADLLYEYFPLSMDDWQAPVDAVYRPHVVHHTHMPMDYKFMASRNRSKRYFAAEDVC